MRCSSGACATRRRRLPRRQKASRGQTIAGWLLLVHALCLLALLWALGAGRYGPATFLTFLAGLAIFLAWELEGDDG